MKAIKNILYPTDFSERSKLGYHYCLQLAQQLGASVHVLHVYRIDFGAPVTDAIAYKMIEERKKYAHLKLGRFAHLQQSGEQEMTAGLDIHAHAAVGMAEDEIVAFSKSHAIDLIVMPTKGEHNLLENIFGSVTTIVGSTASCPLLVLPEKALFRPIKEIAYATDFSKENTDRVQVSVQVADFFEAALHLVHVYQKDKATTEEVSSLLSSLPDNRKAGYHELQGATVPEGIQHFLAEQNIDLLMAYSPPKNFFERLFRLSTARHLLHEVTCPLLIMR
ncbi:MAG: universal stress protein [Aureispira sp.]